MSEPFMGEVRQMSFGFPPKGWAYCNGQLLQIAQYQALFAVLGTTFGGDGRTTFGLPNLQGRTPLGFGSGQGLPAVAIGQTAGEATHTLTTNEMATHVHTANGSSSPAGVATPTGGMLATDGSVYSQTAPNTALANGTIGQTGSDQPHNNLQPYQVLNFVIALQGIFPSRN